MINNKASNKLIADAIVSYITAHSNIGERAAQWLAAQAYHETGGFSSPIFRENKNLFGMKQAVKRKNTAIGTARGHATYKSYEQSVADVILYLQEFRHNPDSQPTIANYINRLKSNGYFEDTILNYYNGTMNALRELYPDNFWEQNGLISRGVHTRSESILVQAAKGAVNFWSGLLFGIDFF